jgi:cytochrome c556
MAVVMTAVIPASTDMYDAINQEMGFSNDHLPKGLISHYAAPTGDGMLIFDVWESMDDFQAFAAETLAPAMEKVTGAAEGSGVKPTSGELYNEFHR